MRYSQLSSFLSPFYFLLPPFYFCFYVRADHPFCAADLCSPGLRRGGSPFHCFALPRRHFATASPALGRNFKCVGHLLLDCLLSLLHGSPFLLGGRSVPLCSDWSGLWRDPRVARFGADSLGTPTGRTFLHAEPLARSHHHIGNRSTFCLRLVARYALQQQRCRRSTLVDDCFRNAAVAGRRCRIDRLLSCLFHWSASPSRDRIPTPRERRYSANQWSRATARH